MVDTTNTIILYTICEDGLETHATTFHGAEENIGESNLVLVEETPKDLQGDP